ncbi:MAG: M3 family metallopeptidase [Gemmatimonadota bacterium]|nr:MAG: M3 family metallopeptidase [Gemmatimonadota bacterium]
MNSSIKRLLVPILLGATAVVHLQCQSGSGPLLTEWDTPFGVPPFDRIEDDHYLPAFRAAMAEHQVEVQAMVDNPEPASFANTIEALERSGKALTRVSNVFFAVEGAHSNDALRDVARTIAPELSAHNDDIALNRPLYDRVKAVYDQRDELDLTPEQHKLLEETHKAFVRSGINLDDEAQARLRDVNSELAELSQRFGQNLLQETNDFEFHVTDTADLGNLPANLVAAAEEEAARRSHDGGWSFTLQRPSINPFLQYSPNRELRRQIFMGYALRGDNDNEADNKAMLSRMAALRAERAALMDYETHAHFVLSDNMAETPARVYEFLDQIWEPALRVSRAERDALQQMMHDDGIDDDLRGWDWRYYAEKVRKARYDLDEQELLPYFEVTAVRDGVFRVANELFGLTFTELTDVPRWHDDQQVFEVMEADGTHIGIMYMDFFTRESKQGGAWMNDLRAQSRLDGDVTPIVTTNFNFPPPAGDAPSLITFDNAQTLAHEFGHALHGLLSNVMYESLSGTNVPRDFVEFPSQIMENWMGEPDVLRTYARHYQTGEVIPDELIEKLKAAGTFNQGFATVEYLAASYLDMAWHTLTEPEEHAPRAFEDAEIERIGLIDAIIPRYRSTYFAHIFSGGYSSGYYSYIWAEVLDSDAFQAFKETSLFDQETARRYRELLSKGGSRPGMELYEEFRGRPPTIQPLLEKRGLTGN